MLREFENSRAPSPLICDSVLASYGPYLYSCFDSAFAAVAVRHGSLYLNLPGAFVHAIYQNTVALFYKLPPEFSRSGQLGLVRIEFFVQVDKLPNTGVFGKGLFTFIISL